MEKVKKARIEGFDMIRAISAIIIIIYHFACETSFLPKKKNLSFLLYYKNGNWGEITAVALFFMISGASLVYVYSNIKFDNLLTFYKKRWLSIFPPFLLVWGFNYIRNVIDLHNLFYAGDWKVIMLSLLGMDGYFKYLNDNYYYVGEWFLGAIVFLYWIFPILLVMYKKMFWISTLIFTSGLIFVTNTQFFEIFPTRNLITCIFCMWLGMAMMKFFDKINKNIILTISAAMVFIFLMFVPIRINIIYSMIIVAVALFIIFINITPYLYKISFLKSFINFTSNISYPIFILQHLIILWIVNSYSNFMFSYKNIFLVLLLTFVCIYFFSWILFVVTKEIVAQFAGIKDKLDSKLNIGK